MDAISSSPNGSFYFDIHQSPEAGLTAARQRVQEAANKMAKSDFSVKNAVDLKSSEKDFEANAKVLKTEDENKGTLLNTLA